MVLQTAILYSEQLVEGKPNFVAYKISQDCLICPPLSSQAKPSIRLTLCRHEWLRCGARPSNYIRL